MGLPGCLFVCHLILLLMCFLFKCTEHGKVTMVMCGKKTFAFTMQVKYGRLTVTFHGDAVVDGYKLLVSINHSEKHSVQLTEEELCSLLTNIDLDYPNIVKKQQYQQ